MHFTKGIFFVCSQDKINKRYKVYVKNILAQEIPIEFRPVDPSSYFMLKKGAAPRILCWVKAKGHIGKGICDIKL